MLHSAYVQEFGNYKINPLAHFFSGSSVQNHIALGLREQQIKEESTYIKKEEKSKEEDKGCLIQMEDLNTHTCPIVNSKEQKPEEEGN